MQEAFSPDPHDVEEAQQLVAAFEQHEQQGTGAFTFRCTRRAWHAVQHSAVWCGAAHSTERATWAHVGWLHASPHLRCPCCPCRCHRLLCRDKMIDQPTYLQAQNLLKFAQRLGVS